MARLLSSALVLTVAFAVAFGDEPAKTDPAKTSATVAVGKKAPEFKFKDQSGKLACAASERAQPPSTAKHSARGSMLKRSEFQYLDGCRDPPNGLEPKRLDLRKLPSLEERTGDNEDQEHEREEHDALSHK